MKILIGLIALTISLFTNLSFAQDNPRELRIKKTASVIKLDGIPDEEAWTSADIATNFKLNKPYDSAYAKYQTKVKVCFDDKFLYISAQIFQPRNQYIVSSYKRDFEGGTSDVFSVNIDTFKDKQNAFQFSVNPLNVQREGLIAGGDRSNNSWDNKWYSAVKNYDDYFTLEMAIPFTTLRYKIADGDNSWRINFGRNFLNANEISTWSPVPRNFRPSNLAFTGLLIWEQKPPKPGANISLIPFLSASTSSDFPRNQNLESLVATNNSKMSAGFDAKVAVTPSLNLDLTVNPDFSQVEVDKQQTNLSRFELFFPEKRQFFIENADLFGTFGFPETRPFFSRRIGIARNPVTGINQQVPIRAGARLSGKINELWRVGVLNMQTAKVKFDDKNYLPAANYTVGVIQRKILDRSSIGAVLVNKENFNKDANELKFEKYNRVAGLEFNYFSKDNKWESEIYHHMGFGPVAKTDNSTSGGFMGFHHPHLDLNLGITRIGKDYKADVGFVPRIGTYSVYWPAKIILNPGRANVAKQISSYGIGVEGTDVFDLKGMHLDGEKSIFLFFNSPSGAEFSVGRWFGYTNLLNSFDPTNADDNPNPDLYNNVVPLPKGRYRYQDTFIELSTGNRSNFALEISAYTGGFFNGKNAVAETRFRYRLQPYGFLSFEANVTDIKLPKPYNAVRYFLLGPKAEMSLNRSMFLSTFFQYNTQANNTNINARFQWRFKPVSDLYLVYTDNYFSESIGRYNVNAWAPKNRALVLKITYWFNV